MKTIKILIKKANLKLNCIIYPKDNSYCMDLNNKEPAFLVSRSSYPFEDGYLPSDFGPFLLTKFPYEEEIVFLGEKKKKIFVNCLSKSTNKEYRVLYHSELRREGLMFI